MKKIFMIVIIFIFTNSCMSIFRDSQGDVYFKGDNITLEYENQKIITPNFLILPRNKQVRLRLTKKGITSYIFIEAKTTIPLILGSLALNATHGIFTFGITGILGFGYDLTTGSLRKYDTNILK